MEDSDIRYDLKYDEDGEFMNFETRNYNWHSDLPVPEDNLFLRFQY